MRCEAATRRCHGDIADGDVSDIGSNCRDKASAFSPERAGIPGIQTKDIQHIAEVEAPGLRLDLDLVRTWSAAGERRAGETIQRTELGRRETPGFSFGGGVWRVMALQARRPHGAAAQRNLGARRRRERLSNAIDS